MDLEKDTANPAVTNLFTVRQKWMSKRGERSKNLARCTDLRTVFPVFGPTKPVGGAWESLFLMSAYIGALAADTRDLSGKIKSSVLAWMNVWASS